MPYLWIVVYSCWFFRPVAAAVHLLVMALSYAAVLVIEGLSREDVAGYVATVLTLAVASYLISRGRERVAYLLATSPTPSAATR